MNKNIKVVLKDKDCYKNAFDETELNTELSSYIYEECLGEPLKGNIAIIVEPLFAMNDDKKEQLVDMIRRNYGMMVRENEIIFKYSLIWKFIVFMFGVILLILSYFINFINNYIISEFVSIIFCVAIWETVYSFLFENVKQIIKIKRYKKLTKCKIIFEDKENNVI